MVRVLRSGAVPQDWRLGRQKWHSLNRAADKSLLLINMKVQQTRPGGWCSEIPEEEKQAGSPVSQAGQFASRHRHHIAAFMRT